MKEVHWGCLFTERGLLIIRLQKKFMKEEWMDLKKGGDQKTPWLDSADVILKEREERNWKNKKDEVVDRHNGSKAVLQEQKGVDSFGLIDWSIDYIYINMPPISQDYTTSL